MNGAMVAVALVLGLTILLGAGAIPAARAAPVLVQQASGGGSGTSYTITLTGVTTGDMIAVAESEGFQPGCSCSSIPITVTDTQSNGYTMVVQGTSSDLEEGSIWYAIASSGGTDVITVTLTGCQTYYTDNQFVQYAGCGNNGAAAYDLSGFTPAGAVSSTGLGGPGCCSVTSFTPTTGSFVVAAAGVEGLTSPWTAGSGYTLSTNDSPFAEAQAQYLVGWSGGSTTAPMTATTVPATSLAWTEAAAAFPVEPVVTTTGTSTVTTTQTLTATATSTSTAIVTQTATTTVNTGTCATESTSTFGPPLVIKADTAAGPTITDTTTVTTTSTATVITTVTQTVTSTSTGTVISTQYTCTTSPPTRVPQFPAADLCAIMLVALLLPVLLLMNRMRFGRRLA